MAKSKGCRLTTAGEDTKCYKMLQTAALPAGTVRRVARKALNCRAVVVTPSGTLFHGRALDIHTTGVTIILPVVLLPGSLCTLRVVLVINGGSIEVTAKGVVVTSVCEGWGCRAGIQFTNLGAEDVSNITRLTRNSSTSAGQARRFVLRHTALRLFI